MWKNSCVLRLGIQSADMLGQSEGEDLNVVSLTEIVKKSYVA